MSEKRIVPFGQADDLDLAQKMRTAAAPLPTEQTLKHRTNLAVQLGKFLAFNVRFAIAFLEEEINSHKRV